MMREVLVKAVSAEGLAMRASAGPNAIVADEPVQSGGADSGPSPHELLLASLGTCTAITLRLYARRKGWPLEDAHVRVSGSTVDGVFVISCQVDLEGNLDTEQRARLLDIAGRCPVHRTLTGQISIQTAGRELT
jgi:putative redox protein